MTLVILLARLLLAGVFLVSAVAKIRDRSGSRTAVEAFGVPAALAPAVTVLLPIAEVACAVLLLVADPGATLGAVASVLLLLAFTVAIVVNLARGNQPDCHCFGQLSNAPTGWRTVVRNALLLLLALLPLTHAGDLPAVTSSFLDYSPSERALGLVLLVLACALAFLGVIHRELVTRYGSVLLRLEEIEDRLGIATRPPVPAPDFSLPDLDGQQVALAEVLQQGRPALVVLISPSCSLCSELLPDLERWQSEEAPLAVLLLSTGSAEANRDKIVADSPLRVLLDSGDVAIGFGSQGTPAAFLVGVDGLVAGAPAYGVEPIRELHQRMAGAMAPQSAHGDLHQIQPRPAAVGDPLPELTVLDEAGEEIELAQLLADDAMVVFWRADCGYCAQITEDVAALADGTPLVIVTTSAPADVRATGVEGRFVSDPSQALEAHLRVPGTPSAVRVAAGRLASELAVGGPAVLGLLRQERVREHSVS